MIIKNAKIYTMNDEVIDCGSLVIGEGKIKNIIRHENQDDIDKDINVLIEENLNFSDKKIIDAKGHMILPGIIDAHCHLGMLEDGMGFEGDDLNEMTDPITPELRAIDALNPMDIRFKEAYESGITSVATGPGSSNIVCGQFAAIKTYGRRIDEMVIKEPVAMKLALGENPKSVYGKNDKSPMTRMAIASKLRELLFKTKEYMEDENSSFDMKLEAMKKVMTGEIPLKVHAHRSDDIFTAIRIAKEFDLKLTIDHCSEGHLIADYLKEENLDCIVGPSLTDRSKIELRNLTFETPKVLNEAGVKFALMTDSPEVGLDYLPLCAGLAVRAGLDEIEALKAITINPAEILGIDDRVGSIEEGKDADLVIFSSNPLKCILSEALLTVIDGRVVYENFQE